MEKKYTKKEVIDLDNEVTLILNVNNQVEAIKLFKEKLMRDNGYNEEEVNEDYDNLENEVNYVPEIRIQYEKEGEDGDLFSYGEKPAKCDEIVEGYIYSY